MAVPKNTTFIDPTGKQIKLSDLAPKLNHTTWQRRACGIGTKGYRVYDWALLPSADPNHQYMIRKSIDDGELAYYHCRNPKHAGFSDLVTVAGARWPIEECFGAGKNEVGLDDTRSESTTPGTGTSPCPCSADTFLAITAHKARKRGPNEDTQPSPARSIRQTNRTQNATTHSPTTHRNSRPPKYADSSQP